MKWNSEIVSTAGSQNSTTVEDCYDCGKPLFGFKCQDWDENPGTAILEFEPLGDWESGQQIETGLKLSYHIPKRGLNCRE